MLDQYGLRAHNRRVANPHTTYHTPTYYAVRSVCRGVVRLIVGTFWLGVMAAVVLGSWVGALALGELVASWAK